MLITKILDEEFNEITEFSVTSNEVTTHFHSNLPEAKYVNPAIGRIGKGNIFRLLSNLLSKPGFTSVSEWVDEYLNKREINMFIQKVVKEYLKSPDAKKVAEEFMMTVTKREDFKKFSERLHQLLSYEASKTFKGEHYSIRKLRKEGKHNVYDVFVLGSKIGEKSTDKIITIKIKKGNHHEIVAELKRKYKLSEKESSHIADLINSIEDIKKIPLAEKLAMLERGCFVFLKLPENMSTWNFIAEIDHILPALEKQYSSKFKELKGMAENNIDEFLNAIRHKRSLLKDLQIDAKSEENKLLREIFSGKITADELSRAKEKLKKMIVKRINNMLKFIKDINELVYQTKFLSYFEYLILEEQTEGFIENFDELLSRLKQSFKIENEDIEKLKEKLREPLQEISKIRKKRKSIDRVVLLKKIFEVNMIISNSKLRYAFQNFINKLNLLIPLDYSYRDSISYIRNMTAIMPEIVDDLEKMVDGLGFALRDFEKIIYLVMKKTKNDQDRESIELNERLIEIYDLLQKSVKPRQDYQTETPLALCNIETLGIAIAKGVDVLFEEKFKNILRPPLLI